MRRYAVVLVLPLLLLLGSCTDLSHGPDVQGFPSKLYPYEVTYDAATYKHRRDAVASRMPDGSIALVATNRLYLRNGDVNYEFRPASVFYYLTGFEEPNAVAVIRRREGSGTASELIMFVEERNATSSQWLGSVYGTAGAVQYFGADSAYPIESLAAALGASFSKGTLTRVYANLDDNDDVAEMFASAGGYNLKTTNIDTLVDVLRLIKSPLELHLTRRAVAVSVQAFAEGIKAAEPLMYEYEVESIFDLVLHVNGCPRTSFPTIVASGPNITTIHYDANRRQMQGGEQVMIDFGAEYGYYAADLTRTLPVNGTFTPEQAVIYDIVLKSFEAVIAAAAPGVTFNTLSSMNLNTLIDGLLEKGVISGSKSAIISSGQYRLYVPASLGHHVGLDVHDSWPTEPDGNRVLRAGMVLAIEPHIYLGQEDLTVVAAYRGICARIEDDILITSAGCENLSASLPRTRAGIELLMRSR